MDCAAERATTPARRRGLTMSAAVAPIVRVVPSALALSAALAQRVVEVARESIEASGTFTVALAGGDTPRAAYELLGNRNDAIEWGKVHVFFTDERFVPPEDPRNNAEMAMRAWLSRAAIPPQQVHAIPTLDGTPATCASRYERTLRSEMPSAGAHTFDLAVMGIGADGHTASLFPGDAAALSQRERWVMAVHAPPGTEPRDRITLTLPVLNRSRRVLFAAAGVGKRHRVAETLAGSTLPAAMVRGLESTEWLLDAAAAPAGR
jgi:6-phosphogluconolactonase